MNGIPLLPLSLIAVICFGPEIIPEFRSLYTDGQTDSNIFLPPCFSKHLSIYLLRFFQQTFTSEVATLRPQVDSRERRIAVRGQELTLQSLNYIFLFMEAL
jgi:hypothetical protein